MATPNNPAAPNMVQMQEKMEVPNKPKWECAIISQPKQPTGFTVGEKFTFACSGEPLELKEPLTVKLPEKFQYALVLLKPIEATNNKISYEATSYRAGQFKFDFLDIVDGNGQGFISNPMQWQTASVMDPQKPQEQPFGPIGPMSMGWPFWFFFSIGVAIAVILGWFLVFSRHRLQRKNLERNIRKYQSPMGSYHQFSKDIRMLKRGVVFSPRVEWPESQVNNYLQRLDEVYRMFILREYIVPAHTWSTNAVIKHMKRKDRNGYPAYEAAVIKAFKELERSRGQTGKVTGMDCEQITNICSVAVDSMWKHKVKKAASS